MSLDRRKIFRRQRLGSEQGVKFFDSINVDRLEDKLLEELGTFVGEEVDLSKYYGLNSSLERRGEGRRKKK